MIDDRQRRLVAVLKFPADKPLREPRAFLSRPIGPIGGVTLFAILYCTVFWYLIEDATICGNMLQTWKDEAYDHVGKYVGSSIIHGHEGGLFYRLAMPFGVLVYPIGGVTAAVLCWKAWKSSSTRARIVCLVLAGGMVAIVLRFWRLGVLECAIRG